MMIYTSFYTLAIPILFSVLTEYLYTKFIGCVRMNNLILKKKVYSFSFGIRRQTEKTVQHLPNTKTGCYLRSASEVMHAAEPIDPCPIDDLHHIVANMCTNESAVEESNDGYKPVDSVLLRIKKQQNNCICHVSLLNTVTNYTIYMSKYDGLTVSAPEQQNCGLAVDIEYLDSSNNTRSLESIKCTSGTSMRAITLVGNELTFKSRIINGNLTRGYCMQIYRFEPINDCEMNDQLNTSGTDGDWIATYGTQHTSLDECKQYCLQSKICVAVHYEYKNKYCFVYNQTTNTFQKDQAVYSKKHCVVTSCSAKSTNPRKLQIKCYPPDPTTQTSRGTTTEENFSTKTETVTTPIRSNPPTNSNTHSTIVTEKKSTKDKNSDLYVYIGAGAGGLLMILLIVCIIVCIRKRVHQTPPKESKNDSTKQFCKEDRDSDNDYGGLKDNILYVSSEPNEILEDGNYNTVDLEKTRKVDQDNTFDGNYSTVDGICNIIGDDSSLSKSKPVIKPKPKTSFKSGSVDESIHLSTMDNGNNEYAVVDKGRNSDDVKHINPEHGNDTEYAVVNKVKRSSNNN